MRGARGTSKSQAEQSTWRERAGHPGFGSKWGRGREGPGKGQGLRLWKGKSHGINTQIPAVPGRVLTDTLLQLALVLRVPLHNEVNAQRAETAFYSLLAPRV